MDQNLLKDVPTLQLGKTSITKELSETIGLIPVPFEILGIKSKDDFLDVVNKAASEIYLIEQVEALANQTKLKKSTPMSYLTSDQAFEVAFAHSNSDSILNRLIIAKYTLQQLFSKRDTNSQFAIVVPVTPTSELANLSWGYKTLHITLEGDEVKVVGTF